MLNPPPKFTALLFDLDGTLLDTSPDLARTANLLYSRHQRPVYPFNRLRSLAGDGIMAYLQLGFGPHIKELAALKEEFIQIYLEQFGHQTLLFPGIEGFLRHLCAQNIPWGIVTNKPTFLTDMTLKHFPIFAQAGAVVCGDTLPQSKPAPEPLWHACSQLSQSPETCAFIGDHERDILAGHAAHMFTIVAAYGYVPEKIDLASWGADSIITDVEDFYSLI